MAKRYKPPPPQKRKDPQPKKVSWRPVIFALILIVIFAAIIWPLVKQWQCKAKCMETFKGPYPEIACKYECPSPFRKK